MYSHETHFEVDIDAHIFGFLARKMFPAMLRKLDQMVLDIGFRLTRVSWVDQGLCDPSRTIATNVGVSSLPQR